MKILSVNCGSSSLKFQMYEMPEEKVLISGYVEKIGQPDCFWTVKVNGEKIKSSRPLANHTEAVDVLIENGKSGKAVAGPIPLIFPFAKYFSSADNV